MVLFSGDKQERVSLSHVTKLLYSYTISWEGVCGGGRGGRGNNYQNLRETHRFRREIPDLLYDVMRCQPYSSNWGIWILADHTHAETNANKMRP